MPTHKINKLLIGTNNRGKLREIRSLLPKNIEIHSTSEFNLKSPIENGKTFKENFDNYKIKYFNAFNEDPSHLSLLSYDLIGLVYYLSL